MTVNTGSIFVVHQQDTLIGLRHQLDEVKAINVEMYQKMQVQTQASLPGCSCSHML